MPDTEFASLRSVLENSARPPAFAQIRNRRTRRNRRSALVAAILLLVTAAAAVWLPLRPSPPAHDARSQPASLGPVLALDGSLYAIQGSCPGACPAPGTTTHLGLYWSSNQGHSWSLIGGPAIGRRGLHVDTVGGLLSGQASDDDQTKQALWYVAGGAIYSGSRFGGPWHRYVVAAADQPAGPAYFNNEVAWFSFGSALYFDRFGQAPVRVDLPPSVQSIEAIVQTDLLPDGGTPLSVPEIGDTDLYLYVTADGAPALLHVGDDIPTLLARPCLPSRAEVITVADNEDITAVCPIDGADIVPSDVGRRSMTRPTAGRPGRPGRRPAEDRSATAGGYRPP